MLAPRWRAPPGRLRPYNKGWLCSANLTWRAPPGRLCSKLGRPRLAGPARLALLGRPNLAGASVGLGCITRSSSVAASCSRQTSVCDNMLMQQKPWRTPSVQTHSFLSTPPRRSWIQSKCGRAWCAEGGWLQLRPSQSPSSLSCYRRGQAVLGATASVPGEHRYLCTCYLCFDCTIKDSNAPRQGVQGWEDAIVAGCRARLSTQLC